MELNVTFIIQLVAFLLTVVLVSNVAFGPILHTLDERARCIDGARAEAQRLGEAIGSNAGVIEKRLSEARLAGQEELARLKAEGSKLEADLIGKAKDEANKSLTTAKDSLKTATDKARTDLKTQAQALAEAIAAKALGRNA